MRRDSRLSGVLHVLLHVAREDGPVTSEVMAKAMNTNPVVIRRILAGLRDAGYVRAEKGHGGGWTLNRDLQKVTLRDIYRALGAPPLFAIGNRSEHPDCLVEKAVNAALSRSIERAETLLLASFSKVTLAALAADVRRRSGGRKRPRQHSSHE